MEIVACLYVQKPKSVYSSSSSFVNFLDFFFSDLKKYLSESK